MDFVRPDVLTERLSAKRGHVVSSEAGPSAARQEEKAMTIGQLILYLFIGTPAERADFQAKLHSFCERHFIADNPYDEQTREARKEKRRQEAEQQKQDQLDKEDKEDKEDSSED